MNASFYQAYSLPVLPYADLVGQSFERISSSIEAANAPAESSRSMLLPAAPTSGEGPFSSGGPGSLHGARGLRARLPTTLGEGTWDFVCLSDDLYLSLTDAVYSANTYLDLPSDDVIKMRTILDGKLSISFSRQHLEAGPGIYLSLHPSDCDSHYNIIGGQHQRMVVLHCRRQFFDEMMAGLTDWNTPASRDLLERAPIARPLSSAFVKVISELLNPPYSGSLGELHRDAKSIELFCLFLELAGLGATFQTTKMQAKDRAKIGAVRQILLESIERPPTIASLAREVGLNQTKLKFLFRSITGMPIFEFYQNERFKIAEILVRETDIPISEIAMRIGYTHPSNFTAAYKHRFGVPPKTARQGVSKLAH